MGEKLNCERVIGRRIRLRDLHVFLTVTQHGSMAQAAAQLGVSQPAVSSAIADLERTLGVPLFDRSTRGVKPTMFARAMMDRSVAAFDELRQGIRTLENLADPAAGELWIGCVESISALVLPPILRDFMRRYPRVIVRVARLSAGTPEIRELADRNLDLVIGPMASGGATDTELACEPLFDSAVVIAAGARSRWARRRILDLGDLADEPWVLTPPECRIHTALREAFSARGLMPKIGLMTFSIPLRMSLAASGPYLTVFPDSIRALKGYQHSIKILPIELPAPPQPVAIITLKSRKLNPVAQRFIAHLRDHVAAQSC
ncbi:MAG TPA: LysR family transcriptional regulator [Xanthobacteraceae bacterium]|nr:LysR family transcriptional regulator [Xanthobacteraceae bacterium]